MDLRERITEYFDQHEDEIKNLIVQLTTSFVEERTVNVVSEKLGDHPYLKIRGEEYRVGDKVKKFFQELDIPFDEYSRMEGRPNIIGKLGQDKSGERLFMPGHMDVVPAGEGWDTDPYQVVEKDGLLYGRGTSDNKGQLASILASAYVLKKTGLDRELRGQLQIAALSDEEAMDEDQIDYGIGYLVEENLINPTVSVVPDIGEDMKKIDIAEKGRMVVKITAIGRQAHGANPDAGINAIYMMNKLVSQIETLKLEHTVHPLLGSPTVNLGEIHGGAAPNIVPGTCFIYLDFRIVPGMTREGVLDALQVCIDQVPDGDFQIKVISAKSPHAIEPDNPVVKIIQEEAQAALGITPATFGIGGGTYAKELVMHGVTAVGWGPGDGSTFHVANEYVEIQQLFDFARLTCLLALRLAG
ncbi:MAG: ArgE/DapE family deacylase [Anaerolineales bacterium]|nr:ArgE/DapE family deacylase [Anaerolineales bacterium]